METVILVLVALGAFFIILSFVLWLSFKNKIDAEIMSVTVRGVDSSDKNDKLMNLRLLKVFFNAFVFIVLGVASLLITLLIIQYVLIT